MQKGKREGKGLKIRDKYVNKEGNIDIGLSDDNRG